MLGVNLNFSPPYLRLGFFLNLELSEPARLAGCHSQGSPCLCLSRAEVDDAQHTTTHGLFTWVLVFSGYYAGQAL